MSLKKFVKWYHLNASIRAKIVLALVFLQGIVLVFFGFYASSVCRSIIDEATKEIEDEVEKAEFARFFAPAMVSCIIMAFALYVASILITLALTRVLTERLNNVTRQADAVACGDLSMVPPVDSKDEIGIVTNSISMMTERLQEKVIEAKVANESKSNFLSRMSHDVRTPMNAIRGMVEIIKKNPEDKDRVADCLKKIEVSTSHLLVLIDEILDMSKMESGELELTNDSFDFGEVMESCYEVAFEQADERGIHIFIDKSELVNTHVIGCELYTRRIITNILNNSLKFNKDGGSVSIDVSESLIDKKRVIYTVTIEDTGIGMSREFIAKAFDPFTQEVAGARSTYTGTGLGLAIVKKLLDAMGGRIEIESEVGEGTRFKFTLPFSLDVKTATPEEERVDFIQGGIEGSHMLVVEDNLLNLEIAKYMLEDKGVVVDTAENGLIAVAKFEKSVPFTYDLILMDIMMPELDGIEATKRIRNLTRADAKIVPIVALSANTYAEDIKASKDAGMNDHLAKPIDVERMYDVVTRQKKLYDAKRIERPYSQVFTGNMLK